MPTGYKTVARPRTSGRTVRGIPGPGDPDTDAILASRKRTEPFTQEHYASYYVFAKITDREMMQSLHRAGVSADTYMAYVRAGVTDENKMMAYAKDELFPDSIKTWKKTCPQLETVYKRAHIGVINRLHKQNLNPEDIAVYVRSGLINHLDADMLAEAATYQVPVAAFKHCQDKNINFWYAIFAEKGGADIRLIDPEGRFPSTYNHHNVWASSYTVAKLYANPSLPWPKTEFLRVFPGAYHQRLEGSVISSWTNHYESSIRSGRDFQPLAAARYALTLNIHYNTFINSGDAGKTPDEYEFLTNISL